MWTLAKLILLILEMYKWALIMKNFSLIYYYFILGLPQSLNFYLCYSFILILLEVWFSWSNRERLLLVDSYFQVIHSVIFSWLNLLFICKDLFKLCCFFQQFLYIFIAMNTCICPCMLLLAQKFKCLLWILSEKANTNLLSPENHNTFMLKIHKTNKQTKTNLIFVAQVGQTEWIWPILLLY